MMSGANLGKIAPFKRKETAGMGRIRKIEESS
jgi:hypothetical protein